MFFVFVFALHSYVGVFFAVATFIALMVMVWARHDGEDIVEHVVAAFIISVTIIVVAIPEVRGPRNGDEDGGVGGGYVGSA